MRDAVILVSLDRSAGARVGGRAREATITDALRSRDFTLEPG